MSREERSSKRRANGVHEGPREIDIPVAPARRILRLMSERAALERTLQEAIQATLETLGCELEEVEEGIGWSVFDGKKAGTLVARYGPKGGARELDKEGILAAVREIIPASTAPPAGSKAATPATSPEPEPKPN